MRTIKVMGRGQLKIKPDYKNWIPKSMIAKPAVGTALCTAGAVISGKMLKNKPKVRMLTQMILGAGTVGLLGTTVWLAALYRAFDYKGKRRMAKKIIDGIADHVRIPLGGTGLDVGCGSGALTIACAKRNPYATMVGCDIWSGVYRSVFTKELCKKNADAEGVVNVHFEEGNATKLPFANESFDAVTSNYVYHNIVGKNKQELLMETLRVLKKGGTFAIHDLMSKLRYGDMKAFVFKLKAMGYEDVRLIDTTEGSFMSHKEAVLLGIVGSTLLIGKK